MKKSLIITAALLALASCGLKEEFQPVFTGKYPAPEPERYWSDEDFGRITSIADLVSGYTIGQPKVLGSTLIKGTVSTTDRPGNFYKSFYIQDETGGIEIKVGKNGLYNDYLLGQTVYVDCEDLTLGMYGYKSGNYGGMGMAQLGFSDPSGSYETSYMEIPLLIDAHVLRGNPSELHPVTPAVITSASQLPNPKTATQATSKLIGSMVTLKGLTYGNEVFCLLYLDSNQDKKSYTNRVFLSSSNSSDPTCGITTWAMSKEKMTEYLYSGIWDECKVGSGSTYAEDEEGNTLTVGSYRGENGLYDASINGFNGIERTAYSVSQYFKLGSTDIQIRTSGFCKFCDVEIDPDVLSGKATIDVTGVLTLYQGSFQLVVNNIDDITVNR
ncbi:MAG: DUF5689 domain-containing protein [Candidatus Cryptobacteroides sp.]|nr:DUF5689 domain-containing protein [Candidatus Cryptobacteroides sp.]